MEPYNNYNNYNQSTPPAFTGSISSVMTRVYLKMTLALVVTAIVSLWAASGSFVYYFATHTWVIWALIIAEFAIVIGVSSKIYSINPTLATALFYIYAVINGLLFSPIFIVYTGTSIAKTFFITAGTFGAMSVYGYFTDKDLSKFGSFLTMALIGLIIATLVNIFLQSSGLDWIISIVGVLIFIGLTAWDTQKIKQLSLYADAEMGSRLATIGALSLYLDFINIFLYLLRFFGSSRD